MAAKRRRNPDEYGGSYYEGDEPSAYDTLWGSGTKGRPFRMPSRRRRRTRSRRRKKLYGAALAAHRRKQGRSGMARRRRSGRRRTRYASGGGRWRTIKVRASRRRRKLYVRSKALKSRWKGYRVNHRRRNPWLAEYMMGNPRRRRRRGRRRRNPGTSSLATRPMSILKNPGPVIIQGAWGLAGMVGSIALANSLMYKFAPTYMATTSTTNTLVRAASRVGVLVGANMLLGRVLGRGLAAFNAGATVAILGALGLDLMGKSISLGAGDVTTRLEDFTGPISFLQGYRGGMGAYVTNPNHPALRGVRGGMSAYLQPSRNVSGLANLGMGRVAAGSRGARIYE